MSAEVLAAQKWLNTTYGNIPGYIHVNETGTPGTATSLALVSALQIELGISSPTGTFGPATMTASDANPLSYGGPVNNRVKILQHGFWCKGYNPGIVDGDFGNLTRNQLIAIQEDAGLIGSQVSQTAYGMQMKAVLGVDEFKLVQDADPVIRGIQQTLNQRYLAYTGLQPTDGIYSRGTVTALIFAIQAEEKIPIGIANGNFGPTTKALIPYIPYTYQQTDYFGNTYSSASIEAFTRIAQWALYCLGRIDYGLGSQYDSRPFDGTLNFQTVIALAMFQSHCKLTLRAMIGLDEWMSLLLSTGNPDRIGTAFDCATRLTYDTAAQMFSLGYKYVGRYLTGDIVDFVNNRRVAKNLLRREMDAIFKVGLRLFLIYQDPREYFTNNQTDSIYNYFTYAQGKYDAETAFSVCRSLGVPHGEYIYFTVDYDFTSIEVRQKIIPYFQGVNDYAASAGNTFQIGIYGARQTCTLVANAGLSTSSFVAGLSTGYSGNMGYRLPNDWAFDQIAEYPAGTNGVPVSIDKNIASGRYIGFNDFIDSSQDDQWDLISQNGSFVVNFWASPSVDLPVFWAKVKDSNGNFSVSHPILGDYIKSYAFCSMRKANTTGDPSSTIRFVYYRDSGGNFNAGYVDTSAAFLTDFSETQVERNVSNPELSKMVSGPTDRLYILTRELEYYDSYGIFVDTLKVGAKIDIDYTAVSGASYPNYIQVWYYVPVGGVALEALIQGSYAFVAIDFENGVLPSDRTLINKYV